MDDSANQHVNGHEAMTSPSEPYFTSTTTNPNDGIYPDLPAPYASDTIMDPHEEDSFDTIMDPHEDSDLDMFEPQAPEAAISDSDLGFSAPKEHAADTGMTSNEETSVNQSEPHAHHETIMTSIEDLVLDPALREPKPAEPTSATPAAQSVSSSPGSTRAAEETSRQESTVDCNGNAAKEANDVELDAPGGAETVKKSLNLGNSLLGLRARQGQLADLFRKKDPVSGRSNESHDWGSLPRPAPRQQPSRAEQRAESPDEVLSDSDKAKRDEFAKIKAAHLRKKRAGTMTIEGEIEYMKLEAKEATRLRKLAADREYEKDASLEADEDGMFLSPGPSAPELSTMFSDNDEEQAIPSKKRGRLQESDDDDLEAADNSRTAKASRKRTKQAGHGGKRARKVPGHDYNDDDVEAVLQRAKDRNLAKSKRTNLGKKKAAQGKKAGPDMTNLSSMLGNDVFKDVAATAHLRSQPTMESNNRRDQALKDLIASIPDEERRAAQSDKKYLDAAIKDFNGTGSVKAQDGGWLMKGLKTTLKHYQVLGVAFMRRRENSTEEPRGGILADQMGLGKTISMLANIVNGKPNPRASDTRTTLIVASPALLSQWRAEIDQHCETVKENKKYGMGQVIEYRAGARVTGPAAQEILEKCDIVLTTYHEVARSYPKALLPANLVTASQKDAWWRNHYAENRGLLHTIKFHRIVLDEAQAIKNHKGHTSMACRAVTAKYHWAITGTPVLNSIQEFYPYFKFLKEPHTGSLKLFKENFVTPDDPSGLERLNVFLRMLMIRRTHVDTLFQAKLLDLPTPAMRTVWLEFNAVENQIYEIVKNRMIQRINAIAASSDTLVVRSTHVWTLLLRLRQLTSHVLLVQTTIVDLLEREDFERLNAITECEEDPTEDASSILAHLRHVLKSGAGNTTVDADMGDIRMSMQETLPRGIVDTQNGTIDQGGKHSTSYPFRKYLEDLLNSEQWENVTKRTFCSACKRPPIDPQVTSCFHIYCKTCLEDMQHNHARRGMDTSRCCQCGQSYNVVRAVKDPESFDHTRSVQSVSEPPEDSSTNKPKKKGRKKKEPKEGDISDWIGMKGDILPSAKTQAVKAQVMNWLEEDPQAKIIIFTQFIPVTKILTRVCQTESWGYVTYTGEMSHDCRQKTIHDFEHKDNLKIMIAGLKCGGLGLNLTMASRVICMDPWWNSAVEQQAFCRVFRIGQTKETQMTKFLVKNTIDAAMHSMQERKQVEIDQAMESTKGMDKVSIKDLMRLFGPVGEDEQGRPFIFAEPTEEDGQEHMRVAAVSDDEDEGSVMGNEA